MTEKPTAPIIHALRDLKPGDRIWHSGDVREIRHVEPYTSPAGKSRCAAVFAGGAILDDFAHAQFPLATAEEIADAAAHDRRQALAAALRNLAKSILDDALPVPRYALRLGGALESRADLERWAKHLGVEIEAGGTNGRIPVADRDIETTADLKLNVRFQSPMEPEPIESAS